MLNPYGETGRPCIWVRKRQRGPSQNLESLPCLTRRHTPAALLLQTYISLALRVIYLLTFTSPRKVASSRRRLFTLL